ncbi:hypothetical protein T4E_4640 [Trichinella pseudospiralis]|uniref:Uncharacterized protein n=1 Tax=Trichinella pseudospiralis TaxID=6337 RepID=A0A0V0XLT2_TRIPS|nr:hypothetical protein T4E_4640 [Trichinella pseudospiralis]
MVSLGEQFQQAVQQQRQQQQQQAKFPKGRERRRRWCSSCQAACATVLPVNLYADTKLGLFIGRLFSPQNGNWATCFYLIANKFGHVGSQLAAFSRPICVNVSLHCGYRHMPGVDVVEICKK